MTGKAWSHKVRVHKVPLRRSEDINFGETSAAETRPYCLAASSITELTPDINFLATQVWPSARTAAFAVESHADAAWTICEFGCGPGLPSLTAAHIGCPKVIATDIDKFALELVNQAAKEQGLESIVETRVVDLESFAICSHSDGTQESPENQEWCDDVDLFIFSDVFESSHVARGAAKITKQLLNGGKGARVWVFAQTDRSQREVYLHHLKENLEDEKLAWRPLEAYTRNMSPKQSSSLLWLCDVDETTVNYG